ERSRPEGVAARGVLREEDAGCAVAVERPGAEVDRAAELSGDEDVAAAVDGDRAARAPAVRAAEALRPQRRTGRGVLRDVYCRRRTHDPAAEIHRALDPSGHHCIAA